MLAGFFERVVDRACNAFVLNVLVLEPRLEPCDAQKATSDDADAQDLAVGFHRDATIGLVDAAAQAATQTRVLAPRALRKQARISRSLSLSLSCELERTFSSTPKLSFAKHALRRGKKHKTSDMRVKRRRSAGNFSAART